MNIKIGVFIAIVFLLIATIGLIIVFCYVPKSISEPISYEFIISFIGAIIAIANTIFLYTTLCSQNRGISNQEKSFHQERFENTFFNLLNFHRKLTDELRVNVKVLSPNLQIEDQSFTGRSFFSFAILELKNIRKSLESKYYLGQFDEFDDNKSIQAIEQRYSSADPEGILYKQMEKELVDNYNHNKLKFANLIYGITEDRWKTCQNQNNIFSISYQIFCKLYLPQYEQYMRNLITLLQYAHKGKFDNYTSIVTAQMTKEELEFVKVHFSEDRDRQNLAKML